MELRRLRYFLHVASVGSLSLAARTVSVAQPALSRQMQLLESELGVSLFQRTGKGMLLTEEGAYLKDALELPVQEIDTALNNVKSYSHRLTAPLSIGMPPLIAQFFGKTVVSRLRTEMPNLRLRVVEDDSTKLATDLARRLIDMAILVSVLPDQRVFYRETLLEPLRLVVSSNCELRRHVGIPFRELQHLPLILPSQQSGLRVHLAKLAATHDTRIAPAVEVDSVELTKQMVRDGEGVTLLPEPAYRQEADRDELIGIPVVEPELAQSVLWAVKPDWRLPRALYNEAERIVFEEWHAAVSSGRWPATWVFDLSVLSLPFRGR